jgi:hypothetical protein
MTRLLLSGVAVAPPPPPTGTDRDGVEELYPTNTNKLSAWMSDSSSLNNSYVGNGYNYSYSPVTQGPLSFWRSPGTTTATGFRTHRISIWPAGNREAESTFHWNSGAISNGYLVNSNDIRDYEGTLYWRVNLPVVGTHQDARVGPRGNDGNDTRSDVVQFKIANSSAFDASISTICKLYETNTNIGGGYRCPAPGITVHTSWTPLVSTWNATKIVGWNLPNGSVHWEIWIDRIPFLSGTATPRNVWEKWYSWDDTTSDVSLYGGWPICSWGAPRFAVRIDGFTSVDFAILSARSIIPT